MKSGFLGNIENITEENNNFRKVLYTTPNMQLVVMSIEVGNEIGEETHELDQFIRIEKGNGKVIIDRQEHEIEDGDAVVIPSGTKHNVINTSENESLKLYSIYSPPEHKDQLIQKTKEEAVAAEEHFDGETTE